MASIEQPRLHRNNAAEWAMVVTLTPVAWAVRAWANVGRAIGVAVACAFAGRGR